MKLGVQTVTLGLAIPTLCASWAPAQAAGITPFRPISPAAAVQVDQAQIQIHTRKPIPYQPFAMADLKTGQKLSAGEMITLKSGKKIKAGEFFKEINRLEREFNALGYSLRQPGVFKLQSLKVDQALLKNQMAMLAEEEPKATFHTAGTLIGIRVPGLVFQRPEGTHSAQISKSWNKSMGSKDTLGAGIAGTLNVVGDTAAVTASGTARASGAILGNEWDFVRVTSNLKSEKSGAGNANLKLYVVGAGELNLVNQNFSQPSYVASNTVSRQVDVSHNFNFALGPIPMSVKIGARGNAGLQYGLTANQGKLGVALTPKVQVEAYGQGGPDAGIVSGGIGAKLILLKDELRFGAEGGIAVVSDKPALQARVYAYNNMQALAGSLYAWAKVDVWLWEDEWHWDIWKFAGYRSNTVLFDESKTLPLTSQGVLVRG